MVVADDLVLLILGCGHMLGCLCGGCVVHLPIILCCLRVVPHA